MRKLIQIFSAMILVCGFFVGNALAACGQIVFVNANEKIAKVARTDDGTLHNYVIVSPHDLVDPEYTPMPGDYVSFEVDRGRRAFNVDYDYYSCSPKSR